MGCAVPREDVAVSDRPLTIGVTRCSKLDDYVASVEQTGRPGADSRSDREPAQGARRGRRRAADRRRRRRSGVLRRRPPPADRRRGTGPRRVRDRSRAPRHDRRPAAAGDLPRRAGAQRRGRRNAGPGHPVGGRERLDARGQRAEEPRLSRHRGRRGNQALVRARRQRAMPPAAAASTAGIISRSAGPATASSSAPAPPTASSKRSRSPMPRSASACSGIRRTSGRPASSGRCSTRSWRRQGSDSVASGFSRKDA